jgi:N-acetylneuraminic acid mutarotase
MIAWGGVDYATNITTNTGGIYDPSSDTWTATSTTNAPEGRVFGTSVWTGSRMIVWGGATDLFDNNSVTNTGGIFNPTTNSWGAMTLTNAPLPRAYHSAVWTGSKMLTFGGVGYGDISSGLLYNDLGEFTP